MYLEMILMKKNSIKKCTHPVPNNKFGIFAMHCSDNVPMSKKDLQRIFDGPISEVESSYQHSFKIPVSID